MTFDDDAANESREYPMRASGAAAKKWSIDDDEMWAAIRMQILARRARWRVWNNAQPGRPPDGCWAN